MDVGVELEVVAVELVEGEVEKLVRLALEVAHDAPEVSHQTLHALEVVAGEGGELLDRREHVDQLLYAPAEEVELAEDDILVEVELLALWVVRELLPHQGVGCLVLLVRLQAGAQVGEDLLRGLLPHVAWLGLGLGLGLG